MEGKINSTRGNEYHGDPSLPFFHFSEEEKNKKKTNRKGSFFLFVFINGSLLYNLSFTLQGKNEYSTKFDSFILS